MTATHHATHHPTHGATNPSTTSATSTDRTTRADDEADGWLRFALSTDAPPKPAPIRRWVQSPNAGHLSGLVWGTGKPDVVLVHDLGDSSNGWDGVSIRLESPVVALDLPGHGRSSDASSVASPTRQAPALIDAIRSIAPTASLVVASGYGAAIALHAAAKRPQSIRALLIVDGSPTASGVAPAAAGSTLADADEAFTALVAAAPRRSAALNRHLARETTVVGPDGVLRWRYQLGLAPADLAGWLDATDFRDVTQPIGIVTVGDEIVDPLVRSIVRRWPAVQRQTIDAPPGDLIATAPAAVAAAIESFAAALAHGAISTQPTSSLS